MSNAIMFNIAPMSRGFLYLYENCCIFMKNCRNSSNNCDAERMTILPVA